MRARAYRYQRMPARYHPTDPSEVIPSHSGDPHHLINRTQRDVVYLAIDDRKAGDTVIYPHDDLGRALAPDCSGMFVHSDRRPY